MRHVTLPSLGLGHWLGLLVFFVVFLPALHVFVLTRTYLDELQLQEKNGLDQHLAGIIRDVSERVDHVQAILQVLSQSDAAQSGNWRSLQNFAERIVAHDRLLNGITLTDADGRLVFGAGMPHGAESPFAGRTAAEEQVLQAGRPVLSAPFRPPANAGATPAWLVAIGIPIRHHDKATYVLHGVVTCAALRDLLTAQQLPDGWLASITDREGTLIARSIAHEASVGTPANAPMAAAIHQRRLGQFPVEGRDGVAYLAQVDFLQGSDWSVQIGVPEQRLTERARSVLWRLSGESAFTALGVLLLGGMAIRRLATNMRNIVATAEAAATLAPVTTAPTGIRELDAVQEELKRIAVEQGHLLQEARHRADELAKTRAILDEAQRVAHIGTWQRNLQTGEFVLSPGIYAIYRLAPGSFVPSLEDFFQRIHPDDRARIERESASQSLNSNAETEFRIIAGDGSTRTVATRRSVTIRDTDGTPMIIMGLIQDVTERRAAADALRRSDERFRLAMEATAEGIWDWDIASGEVYCSQGYAVLLGEVAVEFWSHIAAEVAKIHPADIELVQSSMSSLVEGHGRYAIEFRIRHRDGSYRWVLSRAKVTARSADGAPQRAVGTLMDITEQKLLGSRLLERHLQLEAERDFIATVLNTQAALVAVFDCQLKLIRFNPACSELLGPELDAMLGTTDWWRFFPSPAQASLRQALENLSVGAPVTELESPVLDRHGEVRTLLMRISAMHDPDGARHNIIGTGIDVTERHRAEDLARERMDDLARLQRLHTANELAAVIAHELNQPLAATAAYTRVCHQLLGKEPLDKPRLSGVLDRINEQSLRAGEIIHHMRRLASGGKIVPERLDLNAVCRSARELMLASARRRNIRLHLDLAPHLPSALGVPVQVEQVLLNLLRNAVDAIVEQGTGEGTVVIQTWVEGDRARVTVTDSGPGIPPERAEALFDTVTSHKQNGLGLGLRISRNLMEAHQGRIWVEPHAPGAIFHFDLPVAP